jgi:hypothetical protein
MNGGTNTKEGIMSHSMLKASCLNPKKHNNSSSTSTSVFTSLKLETRPEFINDYTAIFTFA